MTGGTQFADPAAGPAYSKAFAPPGLSKGHSNAQPAFDRRQFVRHFTAGGIALSTSFAIMHPLDTLKTRIQAKAGGRPAMLTGLSSAQLYREVARIFSRGFTVSVLGAIPQGGMRFAAYQFSKGTFQRETQLPAVATSAISAMIGDLASSFVKVPREVITQRLQTDMYRGPSDAVRSILRTEGISGFYTGFLSSAVRDLPFMVILFVTYEQLKIIAAQRQQAKPAAMTATASSSSVAHPHSILTEQTTEGGDQHHHAHIHLPHISPQELAQEHSFVCGGIAGALAGLMTTPFDVIKTRIMTATKTVSADGTAAPRLNMRIVARQLYAEAGPKAFFAGSGHRSFWWFCVCSIFFQIYEQVKSMEVWEEDDRVPGQV